MKLETKTKLQRAIDNLKSYSKDVYKEDKTKPTRKDMKVYILIETAENALKNKKPNAQTEAKIDEFANFISGKAYTVYEPGISGMNIPVTVVGELTNKELIKVATFNEEFEAQAEIEKGKEYTEENYSFEMGV